MSTPRSISLAVLIVAVATRSAASEGTPLRMEVDKGINWSWHDVPAATGRVTECKKALASAPLRLSEEDGLASDHVTAIAQMGDGAMVFGTPHGLSIWRDGRITTFTGDEYSPAQERSIGGNSALPDNEVQDLMVSSNGVLWIATRSGVCRIHKDQWRILSVDPPAVQRTPLNDITKDALERTMALNDVQAIYESRTGKIVLG